MVPTLRAEGASGFARSQVRVLSARPRRTAAEQIGQVDDCAERWTGNAHRPDTD